MSAVSAQAAPRVLLITDRALADDVATVRRARSIVHALGAAAAHVAFAVRDHDLPVRRRLALARALVAVVTAGACDATTRARVWVHDRVDVVLASGADGVQLGERSIAVADARALLGERAFIGRSCHDVAGVRAAREVGADGATLSPLFASPGKGTPLGEERFAAACAEVAPFVVWALGGVDAENAARARAAGAHGVALIRGWLAGDDAHADESVRALVDTFA